MAARPARPHRAMAPRAQRRHQLSAPLLALCVLLVPLQVRTLTAALQGRVPLEPQPHKQTAEIGRVGGTGDGDRNWIVERGKGEWKDLLGPWKD